MSPKAVAIWAVAAAVTVLAAILVALGQPRLAQVRVDGAPAFPELRRSPEAVARIVVETPATRLTVERGDEGWRLAERAGHPASPEAARGLIAALADLRLAEAKTARPERHARLEVEDPSSEGARSRGVRLEDAGGKVLAAAVIGRQTGYTAGREAGTYIRRPDEDQAWLAAGAVAVPEAAADWLAREILSLPVGDLARIEVAPAEGPAYAIVRDPGSEDFRLDPAPEGRAIRAGSLGRVAGGLARLELTEVEPRDGFARDGRRHGLVATLEGGFEVRMTLIEDGEERWLLVDSEATGGRGETAARLAPEVSNWAYGIDRRAFERLTVPLEDHLEEKDGTS